MKRLTKGMSHKTISVLDIGTSKICCWIAAPLAEGGVHLMGYGFQKTQGYESGRITDIKKLENSINEAIQHAEQSCHETVNSVIVSINGPYLRSSLTAVDLTVETSLILEKNVQQLLKKATDLHQDTHAEVIHLLPLKYALDGQKGITDPRGMVGEKIEAFVHSGLYDVVPLRNFLFCLEKCHLDVSALVMAPYASGLACLSEDEKKLGCTIIDIGAGSTSFAIFSDGQPIYFHAIPIGGTQITWDLAQALETSIEDAERIKVLYGAALQTHRENRDFVSVPQLGEKTTPGNNQGVSIPMTIVVSTMQKRIKCLFDKLSQQIQHAGLTHFLQKRIVITGGGSLIPGIREAAMLHLGKSVRLGHPSDLPGFKGESHPELSTIQGLVAYTQTEEYRSIFNQSDQKKWPFPQRFSTLSSWLKEKIWYGQKERA